MTTVLLPATVVPDMFGEPQLRRLRQVYLDAEGFEPDENGHLRSAFLSASLASSGSEVRVTFPSDEDPNMKDGLYLESIRLVFERLAGLLPRLELHPLDRVSGIYAFTAYDLASADERGHQWHADFTGQPITVRCGMVIQLNGSDDQWSGGFFDLRNKADPAGCQRFEHRANQGIAFNNERLEHRVTPWTPAGSAAGVRAVLIAWLYW